MATMERSSAVEAGWVAYKRPGFSRRMARLARQQPLGVFGLIVLSMFVFLGIFGPSITPYDPRELSVCEPLSGPALGHFFGCNRNGQDVLSRVIAGARISLMISSAAVFIGAGAGAFLGVLSGYAGRWVDYVIQRSGEAYAAFPALVLFFLLRTAFGPGIKTIIIAIAIGALFGGNRILRGATIIERNMVYVEAARSVGCSGPRIFFRHVIPNLLPLTVVLMSGALGGAILAESGLAFLGLGVAPGTPSWGIDMSGDNISVARLGYWHIVVFPGIAISLVVLAANLLGDSLRDIWDPRLRR